MSQVRLFTLCGWCVATLSWLAGMAGQRWRYVVTQHPTRVLSDTVQFARFSSGPFFRCEAFWEPSCSCCCLVLVLDGSPPRICKTLTSSSLPWFVAAVAQPFKAISQLGCERLHPWLPSVRCHYGKRSTKAPGTCTRACSERATRRMQANAVLPGQQLCFRCGRQRSATCLAAAAGGTARLAAPRRVATQPVFAGAGQPKPFFNVAIGACQQQG